MADEDGASLPELSIPSVLGLGVDYSFYLCDLDSNFHLQKFDKFEVLTNELGKKVNFEESVIFATYESPISRDSCIGMALHWKWTHCFRIAKVDYYWLSLEKSYFGILIQISKDKNKVLKFRYREERGDVKILDSPPDQFSQLKDIVTLQNLFEELLQLYNDDYHAILKYNLFLKNCIYFVKDLCSAERRSSFPISIRFPGRSDSVKIDDHETRVEFFRAQYGSWTTRGIIYIPSKPLEYKCMEEDSVGAVSNSGSFYEITPEEVKNQIRIQNEFFNSLEASNIEDNILVLPNLRTECIILALSSSNIKRSGSMNWSALPRHMIFGGDFGLVGVLFLPVKFNECQIGELISLSQKNLNDLCKLSGIKKDLPVHLLFVKQESRYRLEKLVAGDFEVHLLAINHEKMDLKEYFSSIKKHPSLETRTIEDFASLIMVLHLLEPSVYHLHVNFDDQKHLSCSGIVWTTHQAKIIEHARRKFLDKTCLRLLIRGCPGSGKTLMLLQIAVIFVLLNPNSKVFFRIYNVFSELKNYLQKRRDFSEYSLLKDSLDIGDQPLKEDEISDYGMVLIDEFETVVSHEKDWAFFKAVSRSPVHVVVSSSVGALSCVTLNELIRKSSKRKSKDYENFADQKVEETRLFSPEEHDQLYNESNLTLNCRSTLGIVNFCRDFSDAFKNLCRKKIFSQNNRFPELNYDGSVIPISDAILSFKDKEDVHLVEWNDESREKYIAGAAGLIDDVSRDEFRAPILVCNLCHQSILERVKNNLSVRNRTNFTWKDPRVVLGAQYAIVFALIDLESAACNMTRLLDAATRATIKLVILWNNTRLPYQDPKSGYLFFDHSTCSLKMIDKYLKNDLPERIEKGSEPYLEREERVKKMKPQEDEEKEKKRPEAEEKRRAFKSPVGTSPLETPDDPSFDEKSSVDISGLSTDSFADQSHSSVDSEVFYTPNSEGESVATSESTTRLSSEQSAQPASKNSTGRVEEKMQKEKHSRPKPKKQKSFDESDLANRNLSKNKRKRLKRQLEKRKARQSTKESILWENREGVAFYLIDRQNIIRCDEDLSRNYRVINHSKEINCRKESAVIVELRTIFFGKGTDYRYSRSHIYPVHLLQIQKVPSLRDGEDKWQSQRSEKISTLHDFLGSCRKETYVCYVDKTRKA